MAEHPGRFAWYELMTTDIAAATTFYTDVVGWRALDATTPGLDYIVFTAEGTSVSGLMGLPDEARNIGVMPRWIGYVGVDDIAAVADGVKRLGGQVYVPPTTSNIGRISVVADPQAATLALVDGLNTGQHQPAMIDEAGRVGWHELFAADQEKAFAFYNKLFGWQRAGEKSEATDSYQLFSAGDETIGGMFTKPSTAPVPFWLYYFNVDDIDAAMARTTSGGGQVFEGPHELPGDIWIARCADPQGAVFALRGKRNENAGEHRSYGEIGWSSTWGKFSSRGRLVRF